LLLLQGTLTHFEKYFNKQGARVEDMCSEKGTAKFVMGDETRECVLLPTTTMGSGLMSKKSIKLIRSLRDHGVHFVYVTGARKSTLMERLPIMGHVDAAFGETGGRYLTDNCINLDKEWTSLMEKFCGPESTELPPLEREGVLWDWARKLSERGYEIDARSYYFGFRVDLEKQSNDECKSDEAFCDFVNKNLPEDLATSTNIGKYDFFPKVSGKGNAVRHYMEKFDIKPEEAVALFDDENDLPMADAVEHCYVMQATHHTIEKALETNPHWHQAKGVGVIATEEVLQTLLDQCEKDARSTN